MKRRPSTSGKTIGAVREWVGGTFDMPAFVTDKPKPYRPAVHLWLETATDLMVGAVVGEPPGTVAELGDALETAMRQPAKGRPRRPTHLRVADPAAGEALRARFGAELEVLVAPTPELDEAMASMRDSMASPAPPGTRTSYLDDGLGPEVIGRFFGAAKRLWQSAPWNWLAEEELFAISIPSLGIADACLSVIGGGGEHFGVMVFDSLADYDAFARIGRLPEAHRPARLPCPLFSVNFEAETDLCAALRREVRDRRWPLGGKDAYPSLLAVTQDFISRPLSARDYAVATAVSAVLAQYVTDHAAELELDEVFAGSFDYRIGDLDGEPLATLLAPHPGRPWRDRGLEEAPLRQSGRRLVADFVTAAKAAGRAEPWIDLAEPAALELVEFAAMYLDRPVETCTPKQLEEYLTEILPLKLIAYDEVVAATPESLDAFITWLGDAGHLTAKRCANLRKRLAAATSAYERLARRLPRAHLCGRSGAGSAASSAGSPGTSSGPSPGAEQVTGNASNAANAAPTPVRIAPSAMEVGRWVWDGQGEKPAPKAPCPCGSGHRYKKCCMPR